MGSMDDFNRFIGGVGKTLETTITAPSNLINSIAGAISSPFVLPLICVGGGLLAITMLKR